MRLEDLADDMCLWCGGEIDLTRPHALKRKYCSKECQVADFHQVEKDARLEAKRLQNRICVECGEAVPLRRRDKVTRYCSLACQKKAGESVRCGRYPIICRICAKPFHGHYRHQVYCSNSCKARMGVIVRRQHS